MTGTILARISAALFCMAAYSEAFADCQAAAKPLTAPANGCIFQPKTGEATIDVPGESILQCLSSGYATFLVNARVSGFVDLSRIPASAPDAVAKLPGISDPASDLHFKDYEQFTQTSITGVRVIPSLTISHTEFLEGIGFGDPAKGTTVNSGAVLNIVRGLDVADTTLPGRLDFSNARVLGCLRLFNVTLGADLSFDGAILFSDLKLTCVMADRAATISFSRATFRRDVRGACDGEDRPSLGAGAPEGVGIDRPYRVYPTYQFYAARFEEASHVIEFDNFYFGHGTTFRRASFGSVAKFISNTFLGWADFSEASFENGAIFSSDFQRRANFLSARFSGPLSASFSETVFHRSAIFARARFENEANFSGARFCVGDFQLAAFAGRTNFSGTAFRLGLFDGAVFQDAAGFTAAAFGDPRLCLETPIARTNAGSSLKTYAPPYVLGLSGTRFASTGDLGNIQIDGRVNLFALAYEDGKLAIRWDDIDTKYISIDRQFKSCLSDVESLCLTANYVPSEFPPPRPLAPILAGLQQNYSQRGDQWSANQASLALHDHANAWYRQCGMLIPQTLTEIWGFVSGYGTRLDRNLRTIGITLLILTLIIASARRWLEPGPAEDESMLALMSLPFKRAQYPGNPTAPLPASWTLRRTWTAFGLSLQVLLGVRVSKIRMIGGKQDLYYWTFVAFRMLGVILIFFSIQVFAFTTPFTASLLETLTPWGLPAVDSGRCIQSE